jgi:hypothetical protein
MKLNSRGVKFRAFMVGLAVLAWLYEVWWKPEELHDDPKPGVSAPTPESGASATQQRP